MSWPFSRGTGDEVEMRCRLISQFERPNARERVEKVVMHANGLLMCAGQPRSGAMSSYECQKRRDNKATQTCWPPSV